MRSLGEIAHGITSNLLTRAADVMLKERRRLVLVARETALPVIHRRNMATLADTGAIIGPPVPVFFNLANNLDNVIDHMLERVFSLFDVDLGIVNRWATAKTLMRRPQAPRRRA